MIIYKSPVYSLKNNNFCRCCHCTYNKENKNYNYNYIIYEQKPLKRNVLIDYGYSGMENYFLSFPKIMFKIFFINSLFHLLDVVCTDEGKIYELPLGNICSVKNGNNWRTVCLGQPTASAFRSYVGEQEELCKKLVSSFWASSFNSSIARNIISTTKTNFGLAFRSDVYWKTEISNPQVWQRKTKDDINWIPQPNELIEMGDYN